MKKTLFIIIPVCILVIIVAAISLSRKTDSPIEKSKTLTAEEVVLKLKEQNPNIGKYVTYNEENDINKLLGRPNQYTSKCTFEDKRLEQINQNLDPDYFTSDEINEPTGGSVEVFNNKDDMQKRKDYLSAVTSNISPLVEYSYSNEYILLRLNKGLAPTQAQEYENIFNTILK